VNAIGAILSLTWSGCTAPLTPQTLNLGGSATWVDSNIGTPQTAGPTMVGVPVVLAAGITATSIATTPPALSAGQTFTITLTLSKSGGAPANVTGVSMDYAASCAIAPALPVNNVPASLALTWTGCIAPATPQLLSISGFATWVDANVPGISLTTNSTSVAINLPVLSIAPATASVAPRGSATLTASGGSGAGFSWSLLTNLSGGNIVPATGVYTAGLTGGVTDVVRVVDSLGNIATRNVTVTAGVTIVPATASVAPLGAQTFSASGGSGAGFAWSLLTNLSGGSIVPATGVYTAGLTGGVTDVVRVVDSLGNIATRNVTVTAGVTIAPATASVAPLGSQTFIASGGSGAGYTWSVTSPSGGSIVPATGVYTAGLTGGVTDVVRVTDSLGNIATASVTVGP